MHKVGARYTHVYSGATKFNRLKYGRKDNKTYFIGIMLSPLSLIDCNECVDDVVSEILICHQSLWLLLLRRAFKREKRGGLTSSL